MGLFLAVPLVATSGLTLPRWEVVIPFLSGCLGQTIASKSFHWLLQRVTLTLTRGGRERLCREFWAW